VIADRAAILTALRARTSAPVGAFARVVAEDAPGPLACWGDLADSFDRLLPTDEARIDAFEALRAAGDLSALLVFLDLNRARAGVLAHVWSVARALPRATQCALVSLDLGAAPPPERVRELHPAARRLAVDPDARARDHETYAAHAAALRAFRTRAPQVSEPVASAADSANPASNPPRPEGAARR
jgi:hypothetical protein